MNTNTTETLPLVSIRCIAYNQEKYIKDTLEGFVQQKTTFKFEAIVHDDASTDGTVEIIKEYANRYPQIIKPIFETENQYSKHDGSLRRIMDTACKGKYIALCEGDDYWTDPYKLQKQIDFLENNPDYTMCCTNATILSPMGILHWKRFQKTCDINPNKMIKGGGSLIATCTQVYRKEIFTIYSSLDYCMKCQIGDYPLQILSSLLGRVHYIHESTSVYRYQADGSWTKKSEKSPILEQVPGWISQIIMLQGLDKFSKKKFHIEFHEVQIGILDWICREHINEHKEILNKFKSVLKLPYIYKLMYYSMQQDWKSLYQICFYLKKYYNSLYRIINRR